MTHVFHDAVFDHDERWITLFDGERFQQRYFIDGPLMFTETTTSIRASVDAVRDAICGPWDWWHHGRCENRQVRNDGKVEYDLWPVRYGIHVHETSYPPVAIDGGGWRVRIDLSDHAIGVAYFDIRPETDESTIERTRLSGRFAGVRIHGFLPRCFGTKGFAIRHLRAERGEPGFPFRKGTGWVGLIERLERRPAN
ncbi:MAG: hypothetical protein O3A00_18900 [Planctomycetota bacterium]|nr:hypothetical protein [Planctomycetota bacterium]